MILGSGCLGEQCLDGTAVAAALEALQLERVLLVAREGAAARGLSGLPVAGVRVAWAALPRGLDAARRAKAPRLVVDLRDDAELPGTCREVFDLARAQPGLALAVTTPARGPLATPETVALLLEDLAGRDVRYWHVPSRARTPDADDGVWLERLSPWLAGISLDDVADGRAGLPPGLGRIDFARLAPWTARALDVVLDVGPLPDASLLRPALAVLRAAGLP